MRLFQAIRSCLKLMDKVRQKHYLTFKQTFYLEKELLAFRISALPFRRDCFIRRISRISSVYAERKRKNKKNSSSLV